MNKKSLASLQRDTTHPAAEEFMLLLDGELEGGRAEELREHLTGCWNCRAQQAEFEQAVLAFVKGRNAVLAEHAQAPPRAEARLWQALAQTVTEERPTVLARWLSFSPIFKLRLSAATAALALLVAAGWWLAREPVVSAHELLTRAALAEQQSFARLAEPVIYRQVRVTRRTAQRSTETIWENWRAARDARAQARLSETPDAQTELARVLNANQFDAANPLSVAAFQQWRQRVARESETVTALPNAWRLTTTVAAPYAHDALIEGSLTVRRTDWRPVSQTFKVQSDEGVTEYELTELAFEVVPMQALTAFAAPAASAQPQPAATPALLLATPTSSPTVAPIALPTSLPTAAALQEAEVAARYALHQLQADLGEPLEISHDPQRIIVRGLVETAERKQQLVTALRALPLVSTQIQTVAEAVQQQTKPLPQRDSAPSVSVPESSAREAVTPTVNVFQQHLETYFSERGLSRAAASQRAAQFANAVFAETSAALSEAWALRRLAERFATPPESETARQQLTDMQNNLLTKLRQRSRNLHAQFDPLLTAQGETDAARSASVFLAVERLHQLSSTWLVGAGQSGVTATQVARQFAAALARLDEALQTNP